MTTAYQPQKTYGRRRNKSVRKFIYIAQIHNFTENFCDDTYVGINPKYVNDKIRIVSKKQRKILAFNLYVMINCLASIYI